MHIPTIGDRFPLHLYAQLIVSVMSYRNMTCVLLPIDCSDDGVEPWIIIVAILGGLILLAIIVLIIIRLIIELRVSE